MRKGIRNFWPVCFSFIICLFAAPAFAEPTGAIKPVTKKDLTKQNMQSKAPIEGIWLTSKGRSKVKVSLCGARLCNEIIWLKDPLTKTGVPKYDGRNQNAKLRKRPIIGLSILLSMNPIQGKNFWKGKIYDPERGKSFPVHVKVVSKDILEVKGCSSWGFPCETHKWQRTTAPSTKQVKN